MNFKFWQKKELPDSPPRPQYPELCRFGNGKWAVRRPSTSHRGYAGPFEYADLLFPNKFWWPAEDKWTRHFAGTQTEAEKCSAEVFDFRNDKGKVLLLNGDWI